MLSYTFDWGPEGLSYLDDMFMGTAAAQYSYAQMSGGTIGVVLGGQDDFSTGGMSGGWQTSVNLASQVTATVTFDYMISHSIGPEPHEYGEVLFAVDGQLFGTGGNSYVDRLVPPPAWGVASTGWQTVTLDLGTLEAGLHQLSLGGYMVDKTAANEEFTMLFDNFQFNVTPTGQSPSGPEPAPGAQTTLLSFTDDVVAYGNIADNAGGGGGNDNLSGAGGRDTLFGGAGADTLSGGNHDDMLAGGDGNDIVRGGVGDDVLWGGAGQDILVGDAAAGGGADTFCFSSDSLGSFDIIRDFDATEGDRIDLRLLVTGFDALTDQAHDFVKLQDLGNRTILRVDVDGAGGNPGFVKVAVLQGVTGLDSVDQLFADGTLIL